MNQRGFATLEVILMVVVIGILASVAVPRFTDVTTKANTAKIQADLTTIDTAIQMYNLETGKDDATLEKLKSGGYLMDIPKPPTGSVFIGSSTAVDVPDTEYKVGDYNIDSRDESKKVKRAMLKDNVAGDFGVK